jgi:hypothetical protein
MAERDFLSQILREDSNVNWEPNKGQIDKLNLFVSNLSHCHVGVENRILEIILDDDPTFEQGWLNQSVEKS